MNFLWSFLERFKRTTYPIPIHSINGPSATHTQLPHLSLLVVVPVKAQSQGVDNNFYQWGKSDLWAFSMMTTLHDTAMADTCPYTLVLICRIYNLKGNPNVDYGLWVMMMWQCEFIRCNKCTSVLGAVDNGGEEVTDCVAEWFCICGTGIWIQGLMFARSAFYHLTHTPQHFLF
jgi:hypothetical protein